MVDREHRQLQTVRDSELVEDVGKVVFHRVFAQRELPRDLFVGISGNDRRQDLELPSGQPERFLLGFPARCQQCSEGLDQVGDFCAPNPILSCHDRSDALEEKLRRRFLENNSAGADLERFDDLLLLDGRRQQDCAHRRVGGGELAQNFETRQARHREVEQKDVRRAFRDEPHCLPAVRGLADDTEIRFSLEESADSVADDRMIVREQDADE